MGSVYKQYGYWYIRYDLPPGPDGKRKQVKKSCKGLTKKEAELELGRLEMEVYRNTHVGQTKETLAEFLDRYIADCASQRNEETTLETNNMYIRSYIKPALGGMQLTKITPLHIQEFYNHLSKSGRINPTKTGKKGLAPKTVNNIHGVLYTALKQAVRWRLIATNPAEGVALPKRQRPDRRAATLEEVAIIIKKIQNSKYKIPAWIALLTGMRRQEICGLRWEDFDAESRILCIRRAIACTTEKGAYSKGTKTLAGEREVLISELLVSILRDHRKEQLQKASDSKQAYKDQGWICADTNGDKMKPPLLGKEFSRLTRRAGVDLTIHELRHTQATVLFEAGIQDLLVSERLGHANVTITKEIYTHVKTRQQKSSVDAIDAFISRAQELAQKQVAQE